MGRELENVPKASPPAKAINLGNNNLIDLTDVPEEQVAELKRQYASGMIDIRTKAELLKVDVGALAMGLDSFNTQAAKATQANVSMTVTHAQTSAFGRTEIVVGNTDAAHKGKLSASAAGMADRTIWIVGVIACCAVIIALTAFRH